MRPLLKCFGGKGRIIQQIIKTAFPKKLTGFSTYFEPFLGGGGSFLEVLSRSDKDLPFVRCIAGDRNVDYVNVFQMVQAEDFLPDVLEHLDVHRKNDSEDYFYLIRSQVASLQAAEHAAAVIYLNRACFNGLWRVNKDKNMNTPWGKRKFSGISNSRLRECSKLLQKADIFCCDFEELLRQPGLGDFVYLDPPYLPSTNKKNSFSDYTSEGFGLESHLRLAHWLYRLNESGSLWALSGVDTEEYRDLYRNFKFKVIEAPRSGGSSASTRGLVPEIVVTNF